MLTCASFSVTRTACAALILASALLQGCGQKGPLYRPDPQAETIGGESTTNGKKKSTTNPPAPQTQKEPAAPTSPPVVDPATPPAPPPRN